MIVGHCAMLLYKLVVCMTLASGEEHFSYAFLRLLFSCRYEIKFTFTTWIADLWDTYRHRVVT